MTPKEFKAWFDGFTEAMAGPPNKSQWARIKERVAEIDGTPVTERVFIDRYWPPRYWWNSVTCASNETYSSLMQNAQAAQGGSHQNSDWKSLVAMNALGKADYQSSVSGSGSKGL